MIDMFDLNLPNLRLYQEDVRDRTRERCRKMRAPIRSILQAATGAGKSVIALDLILRCYQRGRRALFIVSGRVLVDQFEKYLYNAGAPYGVIMAGRGRNDAPIQIASKETLASRALRRNRMELPPADLVIIDEAHESMAPEFAKLLEHYHNAVVIGLTATPALGNGKGLGRLWRGLEMAVSNKQLVAEGWLVPCRVFAPFRPELGGVELDSNGDYKKDQLAERMNKPKITGDVLLHWHKYANGQPTVIFGCNIAHAKAMQRQFMEGGVQLGHIDQSTPDEERADIFRRVKNGELKGFTNVSVARRGLDLPCLAVACVVRPTRSLVLWLQMIGRIRRPWEGKTEAIVIDHAGACDFHCMPDEEIEWDLNAKERVSDRLQDAKDSGKIEKTHTCPECHCCFIGPKCPNCGYMLKAEEIEPKPVVHADGLLVERTGRESIPHAEVQAFWNTCVARAVNGNKKCGYAIHLFVEEHGVVPWLVKPKLKNQLPRKKGVGKMNARECFPSFVRS